MIQQGSGNPKIPPVNDSVSPGSDFYSYVNNHWTKKIKLPPYDGSYSVSEEIDDDVRDTLLQVIDQQRKDKPNNPISRLATSFLQYSHQKNSLVTLNQIVGKFNCLQTREDVGFAIGELNRIQANGPVTFLISGDSYKTSECRVFLYEANVGLPGKHYYNVSKKNKSNGILEKYGKMLKQVGELLHQPDLSSLIMIERAIVPCLSSYDERNSISFTYNPYTIGELKKEFNLPWDSMFRGWGLPDPSKTTFIVTNKRYFKTLEKVFESFTMEAWATWFRASVILSFLEFLPPPFDDLHFDFFGKNLKGNNQKLPQKFLMLRVLKKFSPQDLGEIFVDNAVPKETKRTAITLVNNLKKATVQRLRRIDWLEESTKTHAIKKVEDMKFQVAYPEQWVSETAGSDIVEDQPLQNIVNLNIYDTNLMLQEIRCEKSEKKWEDGCFEVNAYYYSEGNMMVIPAGILRPPFFDLRKSEAWNLGGIGSAIGHEITHGFDTDGRMYDAKGNYNNWWSKKDERKYNALTQKVVDLFDDVEYMKGKIDGELTLSENLSDLGGMAIALEALKTILDEEKATMTGRKKAYHDFFMSYAISWRNKDRPQKARESLFTDSHAPAKFRVNKIVAQFLEFYETFDIREGDAGWVPPKDRILLW